MGWKPAGFCGRQSPELEILFVTQHDSPQMMREAIEAGARGYVVKSNAARDLLAAVEAVSEHRVFTASMDGILPDYVRDPVDEMTSYE